MVKQVDKTSDKIKQHKISEKSSENEKLRILVVGVGSAGNNIISKLSEMNVSGVEFVIINTDKQHHSPKKGIKKILIGKDTTHGKGTKGNPELGRAAIEESRETVGKLFVRAKIVFIVAGLGGGTGTGAAPIIAELAHNKGATTVGIMTMPFNAERERIQHANFGLRELQKRCHTIAIVDNNKLVSSASHLSLNDAFKVTDQVLANMIKEIIETISEPSLVNLDFTDFKSVVKKGGVTLVGIGESNAPNRAEDAVQNALRNPLFNMDYENATGALVHISGDNAMTIDEVNKVGEIVMEIMGKNTKVAWGARINPYLEDALKVTLLFTRVPTTLYNGRLGVLIPKLYNMDPQPELKGSLEVDFGLDQIEK